MISIFNRLLVITAMLLALTSCRHEPDLTAFPTVVYQPASGDSVSIGIKPILTANCTGSGCHNSADGDVFPLEQYSDVVKNELVVPGNANRSKLYRCIANRTSPMMPPSGPMSDEAIKTIYLWIEQGAKEN